MESNRFRNVLLFGLFLACGATAPVYELAWSSYLSVTLGSTALAHLVVLTVWLGGLALGSRLFGAVSRRTTRPLLVCGVLQLLLGVYALSFPFLHAQAHAWFRHLGLEMASHAPALLSLKVLCAVVLLVAPCVFMGGVVPLVAAWLQHETVDAARRTARIICVTCLGAGLGAAWAGWHAGPTFGWALTLQCGAAVNGAAGLVAMLLGRNTALHIMSPEPTGRGWMAKWMAGLQVATSGLLVAGLSLLVLRAFSMLWGNTEQVMVLMVVTVILGLALGGAIAASPRLTMAFRWRLLSGALAVASLWVAVSVFRMTWWMDAVHWSAAGLAPSDTGFFFQQIFIAVGLVLVLGIPVALTGLVFPLLLRVGEGGGFTLGDRVGRLLAWLLMGGMSGVVLVGVWLMPRFGLQTAFVVVASGLAVLASWIAWQRREIWVGSLAGVILAGTVGMLVVGDGSWREAMIKGWDRGYSPEVITETVEVMPAATQVLFHVDATEGTFSVASLPDAGLGSKRARLCLDARPVVSLPGDWSADTQLGHLPLLMRPGSRQVLLTSVGSGIAASALLRHGVEALTITGWSEEAARAAAQLAEWNRDALQDARVRPWADDARVALLLEDKTYDVVVAATTDPWSRQAGRELTLEFYELIASRLKPDGMLTQRLKVDGLDDAGLALVLRTFGRVFPNMEIWDAGADEIIVLGSRQAWASEAAVYAAGWADAAVAEDLSRAGIGTPEALWARQLASQRTAYALAAEGRLQLDLVPVMEWAGARACYVGSGAAALARFDERTWQQALMVPGKREALAGLEESSLEPVFRASASVNPELNRILKGEAGGRYPCVFLGESGVMPESLARGGSPEARRLAEALVLLGAGDATAGEGVTTILDMLRERGDVFHWPAGYCAAQAIKACLTLARPDQAQTLLEEGLKAAPADEELLYLERIMERERSRPLKVSRLGGGG